MLPAIEVGTSVSGRTSRNYFCGLPMTVSNSIDAGAVPVARSSYALRMDLRQLRYFVAVADASSFGRAGTLLGIAQSALSTQIARLESELGVVLFARSPRAVSLTPAGRAVLAEARKTLIQADITVDVAHQAARGETGRLRLAYARALPWHLPGRVVKAFTDLDSGAAIDLFEISSHEQPDELRRGKIDAGILIGPVAGDVPSKLIARESLFIACGPMHPFAQRSEVTLNDIKDEQLYALTNTFSQEIASTLLAVFRDAGLSPAFSYEADEIRVLWGMVSGGKGLTFGYRSFAAANIPGLVFLPVVDSRRTFDFYLVWNRGAADPLVQRLVDAVPASE
jgi:DNA-binding transcriptional LysR family regulator